MTDQQQALDRVVAVVNGKGGVLKTSVVANVGGWLASQGMRILLVDLDPQGNLVFDLGLVDHWADDLGKSVIDAVWSGEPLKVLRDVRPNLDVVFGGSALDMLASLTYNRMFNKEDTGGVPAAFAKALAALADDAGDGDGQPYDLILLDCPPRSIEIQDMALRAARWVVVPTRTDDASLEGLRGVGPRVARARNNNPTLDWLGIVVTAHNKQATRILRETLETLAEVSSKLPPFETVIRHSEATARDARSSGRLAFELANATEAGRAERLKALSDRRRRSDNVIFLPEIPPALSETSGPLAEDYARLAHEMCKRITTAETAREATGEAR